MKRFICLALAVITAVICLASCEKILPDAAEFTRGTISNNVYESAFSGIRFAPGPAWTFSLDDVLLKLSGVDEALGDDEKAVNEALSKVQTVYDMTAEDEKSGYSVTVTFENMTLNVGTAKTTIDEYIEKLIGEIKTNYADYGADAEDAGVSTIAGKEFRAVTATLTVGDNEVEQYYYIRYIDGFFMSVAISAPAGSGAAETILPLFEPSTR